MHVPSPIHRAASALTACFVLVATAGYAQQPGVDERPAHPPEGSGQIPAASEAVDPSPVVLLAARYADYDGREGWFAVPVACVDATGSFVPAPEQCVADLPVGATLLGADGPDQATTAGVLEDVPDRSERGFVLLGEPTARLFYLGEAPPRLECEQRLDELNVPAMAELSGLEGPFNLTQCSCWDLNRDGQLEIWLSTGQDSERGYEYVEVRGGRLELVGGRIWLGD